MMRRLVSVALALLLWVGHAHAQETPPDAADGASASAESAEAEGEAAEVEAPPIALDELLGKVRERTAAQRKQDDAREVAFRATRDALAEKLRRAEAQVRSEETQSVNLDTLYGENEIEIELLGERLTDRLGQMGELFGVVRLVSTDMSAQAWESLTSMGIETRGDLLDRLGRSSDLPSTEDLERLWYEVQREMTEQGRVVRLAVPVLAHDANSDANSDSKIVETSDVIRVGPFTAFSDQGYVRWQRDAQMVRELERQPPTRYVATVEDYLEADDGFHRVAVDPSRGTLLVALTDTPSLAERVQAGGYVGYTIIGLGLFALALGLMRLASLAVTGRRVDEQAHHERPDDGNPLGRVLGVYAENHDLDPENLELRLDEIMLRESAGVEKHMWIVQTISIIAPLLGLLGTVTGMIQTFQAITLFGAGDPKMMAGGISEALITTTLGLVIAIPLVLLHALLSSRARGITDLLEERVASLRAQRLAEEMSS